MKEILFTALMFVWLLVGCVAKQPILINAADTCPPVPECRAEVGEIKTNADLLYGFTTYRAAFLQCKLYRDALSRCLMPDAEVGK